MRSKSCHLLCFFSCSFQQACGYEFTSKLHRMFTDMTVSEDLHNKFGKYINDQTVDLGINFSIYVLQVRVSFYPSWIRSYLSFLQLKSLYVFTGRCMAFGAVKLIPICDTTTTRKECSECKFGFFSYSCRRIIKLTRIIYGPPCFSLKRFTNLNLTDESWRGFIICARVRYLLFCRFSNLLIHFSINFFKHFSAEMKLGYLKKTYIMTLGTYQMAVLLLFENCDSCSYTDLQENTQLNTEHFNKQIQSLVDTKLILPSSQVSFGDQFLISHWLCHSIQHFACDF